MRIKESSGTKTTETKVSAKEDKKVTPNGDDSFQVKIQRVSDKNIDERINLLINQIIEQGEKLGKKIDIRELKIYKKLINEFLNHTINNSHKFSKESFVDRRGRYKVYTTVKKVNTVLDDLTNEILKSEKDHLAILQKIEDIRGILLDLVV